MENRSVMKKSVHNAKNSHGQYSKHVQNAKIFLTAAANEVNIPPEVLLNVMMKILQLHSKREDNCLETALTFAENLRLLVIAKGRDYLAEIHPVTSINTMKRSHLTFSEYLLVKHLDESFPYYSINAERRILRQLLHKNCLKMQENPSENMLNSQIALTPQGELVVQKILQNPNLIRRTLYRIRNPNFRRFLEYLLSQTQQTE